MIFLQLVNVNLIQAGVIFYYHCFHRYELPFTIIVYKITISIFSLGYFQFANRQLTVNSYNRNEYGTWGHPYTFTTKKKFYIGLNMAYNTQTSAGKGLCEVTCSLYKDQLEILAAIIKQRTNLPFFFSDDSTLCFSYLYFTVVVLCAWCDCFSS